MDNEKEHVFKELETERLRLKNISNDDRDFILSQFSNEEVNRYLFDAEPLIDLQGADQIVEFYVRPEQKGQHRWILVKKDDGLKIGTCGFHCWDKSIGQCDVGYDLSPDYWGKGYMTEAMHEILAFARDDMKVRRIRACIYVGNDKSIRLAEHLGFVNSGQVEDEIFRGSRYSHRIYVCDHKGTSLGRMGNAPHAR